MEFSWVSAVTNWAKEAGFGPVQTGILVLGVSVLLYLGRLFNGIKEGYGLILQDQKDATQVLRDQIQTEREERQRLFEELAEVNETQVRLLRALAKVKMLLAAHDIPIPADVTEIVNEVLSIEKGD